MLSFISYLKESGDTHHEYKKQKVEKPVWADSSHGYSFKDSAGNKKHVVIHHQSYGDHPSADVSFHDEKNKDDRDAKHKATGELGRSSIKVFSTVKHILTHHAKKHPHIKHYEFSSDNDEPTRVRLYKRMTKHLGGTTTPDDNLHYHHIPTDKLK